MKALFNIALAIAGVAMATQAVAEVTFYEGESFSGRQFSTDNQIDNFRRQGFNDRASSVVVDRDRWEVCDRSRFRGYCVVLRPGRYPSLAAMGMNDRISSVRLVRNDEHIDNIRYAPDPAEGHDYRRHRDEQLFDANVTSVRAVVGPPEQRCWVEREQVVQDRSDPNVPGALAGAVIGGILGHQIGGGSGKDIATVGGVAAGAIVGANVGRDEGGQQVTTQNVQHCKTTPSQARPDYWDVTYNFRGQEHSVQMTNPPGVTVTVNDRGEPRE